MGRRRRKPRRFRQRLIGGDRIGRSVFGIQWFERASDPGGARWIETVDQLTPGRFATFFVVRRAPSLFPEMPPPGQLVGGQLGLVGIDVHRIGIDAHAQLGAAVGQSKEPRFQPHREQDDRRRTER